MDLGTGSGTIGPDAQAALQDAIKSRASGQSSQLNMQSPASAGFDPSLQTPQVSGQPQMGGAPVAQMASPVPDQSMAMSLGAPTSSTQMENETIIKALASKLNSNAAMEKAERGL